MTDLRDEIADIIGAGLAGCRTSTELADRILAIPRLREALKAKKREETIYRSKSPISTDIGG